MYEQDFEKAKEAIKAYIVGVKPMTPLSHIKSLEDFKDEINTVTTIESLIRIGEGKYADVNVSDCLIFQKLNWLEEFAERKHETRSH